MESFYITLPSTASTNLFENTQSHFRVQLPSAIELDGDWVVGLSEIHIPTLWNNVDSLTNTFGVQYTRGEEFSKLISEIEVPDFAFSGVRWEPYASLCQHVFEQLPKEYQFSACKFEHHIHSDFMTTELKLFNGYELEFNDPLTRVLKMYDGKNAKLKLYEEPQTMNYNGGNLKMFLKKAIPKQIVNVKLNISEGLYSKVDHILQAMVEQIPEEIRSEIRFKHNRDGTISIICGDNVGIEFPKRTHGLGSLLGFADDQTLLSGISTGKYTADLKGGVHGLYVYTDIISSQIVGDTHSPLLRVIPVEHEAKYSYVKIYTNPDFYKLLQNRFESIEIDIRTDFGQRLKFRNGKTLVKLLFRKV